MIMERIYEQSVLLVGETREQPTTSLIHSLSAPLIIP